MTNHTGRAGASCGAEPRGSRLTPMMFALAATVSFCGAGAASAQSMFDRNENVSVLNRPRPSYEALGVRAGAFLVFPKVDLAVDYDDNIFAAQTNAVSDTIFRVSPQLSVQSDWIRHELYLRAHSTFSRYADHDSENSDQWNVTGGGRLDIRRDLLATGDVTFGHEVEARTSSTYIFFTDRPIRYDFTNENLAIFKEFNRLKLTGRVAHWNYDYKDNRSGGIPVDEDFRDYDETGLTARADYAMSPATALFIETTYRTDDYEHAFGGLSRDSHGWNTLAGVNFEVSHLLTGEIGAGYLTQKFANPLVDDVSTPSYRAQLEWYPTQLLTITLTGNQRLYDSGIQQAPAYLARDVQARADYELLRNLIVTGRVGYTHDDYRGIDRADKRYGAGLSATYLLNRDIGISAHYTYLKQTSGGANAGLHFTDNVIGLALTLQR